MEQGNDEIRRLLEDIRDGQKKLLEQGNRLVEIAGSELEVLKRHYDRAEKIQDRAEQLQARGEGLVGGAKKVFYVIVPVLIALLLYVSWLLFGVLR